MAQLRTRNGIREYHCPDGQWYPSVSTILKLAQYKEPRVYINSDWKPSAAMERGTAIHEAICHRLTTGRDMAIPDELFPWWRSALSVIGDRSAYCIDAERFVWHPAGYAGRLDCVLLMEGKPVLIDWKTTADLGSYIGSAPTRRNNRLQLAAYAGAWEHCNSWARIDRAATAVLSPDQPAHLLWTDGDELHGKRWEQWERSLAIAKGKEVLAHQPDHAAALDWTNWAGPPDPPAGELLQHRDPASFNGFSIE